MTSNSRPIHHLTRELRSTPDDAEPSFSYEEESFLLNREAETAEDEFHKRFQSTGSRLSSGGGNNNSTTSSFWRNESASGGPSYPSVSLKASRTDNSMLLSGSDHGEASALQTHAPSASSPSVSWGNTSDHHTPAARMTINQLLDDTGPHNMKRRIGRKDSNLSTSSTNSQNSRNSKKEVQKQRAEARRRKIEAQQDHVDTNTSLPATMVDHPAAALSFPAAPQADALSRGSSSEGSLLYGKTLSHPSRATSSGSAGAATTTTGSGVLLGKASSLIFPTGVDTPTRTETETLSKRRKISLLLDQCESLRFPFKKKLILSKMNLTAADIPVKDLCTGTSLGNTLHKLSLSGNRLGSVPAELVQSLPVLKHLDLSQCELYQLPAKWNLPQLRRLNLSHNRLTDFPEESILEGLLELQELELYGNKVAEIILPNNPKLLRNLTTLNMGYNDLAYLPDDLDQLKSLRVLKVMNNVLEKIPMRVVDMDLKAIDVSNNPVIQPPIETCERGISSMKCYYRLLRKEEQSKLRAMEEVRRKASNIKLAKRKPKMPFYKPKFISSLSSSHSATMSASSIPTSNSDSMIPLAPAKPPSRSVSVPNGKSISTPPSTAAAATATTTTSPASLWLKRDSSKNDAGLQGDTSVSMSELSISEVDDKELTEAPQVAVNDTLKVIFVGMAMAGKTSMIKRLMEGRDAVIPKRDERTIGVDIYEWDPKKDKRFEHIDSRIKLQDKELEAELNEDINVKFSVWDFAGQHVYHATHELFFSPGALYVLVWDMGATNRATIRRKNAKEEEDEAQGAFRLSYDSSDEEQDEEDDFYAEEEERRADRALERDIDEKVQFWVNCIQSSAPGAAILPVASFDDYFTNEEHGRGGLEEAQRRCNMLKSRLLRHEERRIQGIKERLKEFQETNRADDEGAVRLHRLLGSYCRPKLIFGDTDEDSVVRVSGTLYTGFDRLTEKIVGIATGQNKSGQRYPIFRGHVGVRIPRMRLEVRDVVRNMRDRFKVVEWGYFVNQLKERGIRSPEDISEALHFLTNVGELSYFGSVMSDRQRFVPPSRSKQSFGPSDETKKSTDSMAVSDDDDDNDDEDDYDEDNAMLSIDNTSVTAPMTEDGSLSTIGDWMSGGLSQFVFLNPRWLVAAVACILRHDLDREIQETRRSHYLSPDRRFSLEERFYEANLNCPVITAEDACLLWQAKKFTKKAAERAEEYSNNMTLKPFEFLQLLLVRFGVFVPIDLSIDKAFLGGKEYSIHGEGTATEAPPEVVVQGEGEGASVDNASPRSNFFFLPSLLGPGEPTDLWTYKNTESWKTTLCHSVLFPDGVPPGLMERITAAVLSSIYGVAKHSKKVVGPVVEEGELKVREVLCWRTAFFMKLGTLVKAEDGSTKESVVEIFACLTDRESHLCAGSDFMGIGSRRFIVSAKGQVGDGGRKIWRGGYLAVCKAVGRVMDEYGGLEFEKQGFCPECLSKKAVSEASSWNFTSIRTAVQNGDLMLHCRHGHRVDTRLIAGPVEIRRQQPGGDVVNQDAQHEATTLDQTVPVKSLLRGVVVVGLWDGRAKKIVRVGSGFIADRKRGLIVTASHTLMNIWGDKSSPFGEDYYGRHHGKVVIGVIPRQKESIDNTMAVFRYFAKIIAKDPNIEKGECHLDACVLQITTRLEQDVGGNGEGCGDQAEKLLLNNRDALKKEKLQQLKVTDKCELDEQIRIIGYNQGGEGLLGPGESLNRYADFARGYVCKKFAGSIGDNVALQHRFKPREEIVVICPTIGGHSGGPCVNQQGEVIGILSRADPAEKQRCYLVPSYEWKDLLKRAKNML